MNKHLLALIPLAAALLVACGPKTTEVEPGTSSGTSTNSSGVVTSSGVVLSSGVTLSSGAQGSSGTVVSSGAGASSATAGSSTTTTSSAGTSSAKTSSSSTATSSTGTSTTTTSSSTTPSISSSTPSSSSAVIPSSSSWDPFNSSKSYGTLTDTRGGVTRVYKTILTYGGTWMAENLDYGTMVPGSSSQSTVGTVEKYCYNDDPANCVKYGALYQWAESMNLESSCNAATCASLVGANHQGLCPTGWHVPTDQDWNSIYSPSGTDITYGAALKSGVDEWGNYGTNASGFSAVPGGYRKVDGTFLDQNVKAFLWSASEPSSALYTGSLYLGQSDGVAVSSSLKTKGYSLRCKQN